jgi:N-terminal half of MaoC dehydratase
LSEQSVTPFKMDVEYGKLYEFLRATRASELTLLPGDRHPFIPPTFLMAAAFWRTPESEVLRYTDLFERSLHATEEFVFPGEPPKAGMTLTAQSRLGTVENKVGRRGGNMTFTEVVTEFRDPSGAIVCFNKSVTVVVEGPLR